MLSLSHIPSDAQTSAPAAPQAQKPPPAQGPRLDFTEIVRQQMPSVVAIVARQAAQANQLAAVPEDLPFREYFLRFLEQHLARPQQSMGSGFVVGTDGYIVTNDHVIGEADDVQVVFGTQQPVPARIVGRDPATDLAVLKIDAQFGLTPVVWGDSQTAEAGSWAIAIGSPFGLGGTVTVGVVSARSRDIRVGPYDEFLQTDASINSGNSGGPLFNARGEVIGVNTAIFSPTGGSVGIGFAVPSRSAQAVVAQLIRTGRVDRGHIGVRIQELSPSLAEALNSKEQKGVLIAEVDPGGPAATAGVRAGDIMINFNASPIANGRDLVRAVAAAEQDTQAATVIIRNGQTQRFSIRVVTRPPERSGAAPVLGPRLGVQLSRIPDSVRRQLNLPAGAPGLVIRGVQNNSPAAQAGLRVGDLLVSINNAPANSPADVERAWSDARHQKRPLLVRVLREGRSLFVAVRS